MSKVKLTDYVVEFLQKKGIHDFFGYQGTMIAHLVDSIEKNPHARSHSSYHEQGAAFAACGYAQAKNACGCAYATSGPGAANLLSGVADAYFDSLPPAGPQLQRRPPQRDGQDPHAQDPPAAAY